MPAHPDGGGMTERHHRFTLDKRTMYQDGHRVLTMTSQCDGVSLQEQDELRARIVRLLNEAEVGPTSDDPQFNAAPAAGWVCFHCGEHFPATFIGQRNARDHFGATPDSKPGCMIKLGPGDRRLLLQLRAQEAELDRYRAEDSDKDRQMAALSSDHAQALVREEEKGYARGLRDARAGFAEMLRKHWLWQVECHHETKTDTPRCSCSRWPCEPQPSVGEAVERWIEHVLEELIAEGIA